MIVMVPSMAFLPLLMSERMSASALQIGFVIACRTLVNAVLQVPAEKLSTPTTSFCCWLAVVSA